MNDLAFVTFTTTETDTKSGTKNGKDWSITEQDASIETPFMRNRCRVALDRGAQPFKVGRYSFNPLELLKVSDFGSIQMGRLKLTPAPLSATKAA